jgi:hypothetical protein
MRGGRFEHFENQMNAENFNLKTTSRTKFWKNKAPRHFTSCMGLGSLLNTSVETKFSIPKVLILGSRANWSRDHLREIQPGGAVCPNRCMKSGVASSDLLKFASGFFEGKPRRKTTNKYTSQKRLRANALTL